MIFGSHACTCALDVNGARNRSGFRKTSTATVRFVLSHGLQHPSAGQTARSRLATTRLYRTGQY